MRTAACLMLGILLGGFTATPASGQDVTGTWVLSVELSAGNGDATFVLTQDGSDISGTYTGVLGEQSVTGTIEGDQVRWSFSSEAGEIRFQGTVDGATMEGTCVYGQLGNGTFEGRRREGSL